MNNHSNIESRPLNGKRVGYAKSSGEALRIYGDWRTGYNVSGKWCRTLREVSAYLETI